MVGYLAGQVRENQFWGTHAWVDHAAHACADPELARDLYAASAPGWIEAGARLHLAMVPATGEALDPWYRLGFGQMQVEGIRASGAVTAAAARRAVDPAGGAGRPRAESPASTAC